jgi:NADPH2:quinone reductase
MKAIRVHQTGGPEVLKYEETHAPTAAADQVLIEQRAVGVNFIDIYQREGLYKLPLPTTLGVEGAGVVRAVGPKASHFRPGDRVAYALGSGGYAELAAVPESKVVGLPDDVDFPTGAAAMVQGLTAHYLATDTFRLKEGDVALVHAAAGGVGLLLVQVCKRLGARVIGTVSTDEKARLAREAGADEIVIYTREDFLARVKEVTSGKGCDVVYDSVGKDTFDKSLSCLRPRGLLALYGQSSGPVAPFDPQILNARGSLFFTRPSLGHYAATHEELTTRAQQLFGWIRSGGVKVRIGATYPLAEAAQAQKDLAGRKTTGKVILLP